MIPLNDTEWKLFSNEVICLYGRKKKPSLDISEDDDKE